jgi:hypothetical protein
VRIPAAGPFCPPDTRTSPEGLAGSESSPCLSFPGCYIVPSSLSCNTLGCLPVLGISLLFSKRKTWGWVCVWGGVQA